jgi:hypothetical protein
MTYRRDDDVLPLIFCNYLGPKHAVVTPFHLPEDLTANDKIHLNIPVRNTATSGSITATGHIRKADDSDGDFDITGTGNATAFSTAWESDATVAFTGSSGTHMKQIARFVFSPDHADYIAHAAAGKGFVFTVTVASGGFTALNSHAYLQRKR